MSSELDNLRRQLERERRARARAERIAEERMRALAESERQLRSLFENASIGIYRTTPDGRVLMINAAQAGIWGLSSVEEALACNLNEATPSWGYDRGEFRELMERVGSVKGLEASFVRRDGSRIVVRESSRAVRGPDGAVLYYEGTVEDITERYEAETLRVERAALERSNRELEQFAYVASHDLQEPLRKIDTFGDLLKRRAGDALDETARDYLERMQSAARRMRGLIGDLLDYSRVSITPAHFVPVDLDAVVRGVLSDLEVRIREVGAEVTVAPLPTLEADARQMQQLFLNLIGNALKFQRPGTAPVVRIHAESQDRDAARSWRILVEDNGIGFDARHLETIFKPFQRLHGRAEYEGSGIGLAICRKIADHHGGTLTAVSEEGRGATFAVELPARHG